MSDNKYDRSGYQILPVDKVVSVVETQEAVDAVTVAAAEAGFSEKDLFIHHGETGKEYIDADGSRSNFLFHLVRSYQRLAGPEKRMLDMAEAALEAGYYLVGIQTDGSEEMQFLARDAIAPYSDYSIFFCGKATITIMVLGENERYT